MKTELELLEETFKLNPGRRFTAHELSLLLQIEQDELNFCLTILTEAEIIRSFDYPTYTLNQ